MELSALHDAVRTMTKGGRPEAKVLSRMSAAERQAVAALRRRVRGVGGEIDRLMPPADALEWVVPPQLAPTR